MMKLSTFKIMAASAILLAGLVILATGCALSDGQNTNEAVPSEELRQSIQSDAYPDQETPFVTREFSPYLGDKWIGNAVSYGCYREGQAPGVQGPSEEEILEDLKIIQQYWNLVRVYGSDSDSERILKVIADNDLPVRVMLGVWLANETDHPERKKENIEQVLKAIELGNTYKSIIAAINVGNETQVFWSAHRMELENLIKYLRYVRNNTEVPVTTADDYNFWNKPESQQAAAEVDFIVTHMYPLWNGKNLTDAIPWMDSLYFNVVSERHPGKTIAIGETGWATTYNPEKKGDGEQGSLIKGEVSIAAQEQFLIDLNAWVEKHKVTTFLFEAFDEPWKGGGELTGPNEIEKHWGVFYENREPKPSFEYFVKSRNN